MKTKPTISVILPVYNAEESIKNAIESVLEQTFRDFELLVIDDGSQDQTLKIIRGIKDSRIKLVVNKRNIGLPASLNKGIRLSVGEFIARMDADDWSLPDRFEKQIEYFHKNKEIDLVGGSVVLENGKIWHYPLNIQDIKPTLLFHNALAHPTVMFRRLSLIKNNIFYDESYLKAQDYELWTRAVFELNFANIGDVVLKYHLSKSAIKKVKNNKQYQDTLIQIRKKYLEKLLNSPNHLESDDLNSFKTYLKILSSKISNFSKTQFTIQYIKNIISKLV